MTATRLSLGLAGSATPEVVRAAARAAEDAGFHALWLNDTPAGDALAGLVEAASVTTRLRLASGVIPLDRRPADAVVADVERLGLPRERLVLGVGSGHAKPPLPLVRAGLSELRASLPDVHLVLGALGPAMRRTAARYADGPLLSWLTPGAASAARDEALVDAEAAGRPAPDVVLYTRTVVSADAVPALEAESARYAGYPNYAAHFARVGHSALDSTIRGTDPHALAAGIRAYDGTVDELVLRAITAEETADAVRAFVAAVARIRPAERARG